MSEKKKTKKQNPVSGPGRLTKVLKIDKRLNTKTASKASGLWIEDRPSFAKASEGKGRVKIKRTPRIGIAYAEEWVHKPLRFVLN